MSDLKKIENELNSNTSSIKVLDLGLSDKNYLGVLKKYEDSKKKLYTCVVWSKNEITDEDIKKIEDVKNKDIIQKTPLRVLHRRALMDRKKLIYSLTASKINEHFFVYLLFKIILDFERVSICRYLYKRICAWYFLYFKELLNR